MIPNRLPRRTAFAGLAVAAALAMSAAAPARAQSSASEAFKGFGSNAKDPIQIEADSLEVRDKESTAVFSGNVHVRQKDVLLKTSRLRVFYEGRVGQGAQPAGGAAGGKQQIRRFEAEGRVLIAQGDQSVTSETGWFDMKSDKAELTGGVVLSQGKNVARGERLTIDLKTGQYKLDGTRGRVQMILEPAAAKDPAKP